MSVLNINRGNAPTNPVYIQLSGGLIQPSRTVTAATDTATLADYLVLDNAASNAITQKLPAGLTSVQTMVIVIKKTDATANVVTIDANGSTIDGASTFLLYTQGSSVTLQWNGATWSIEGFTAGSWLSYTPVVTASGSMTVSGLSISSALFLRLAPNSAQFFVDLSFTLGGSAATDVDVSAPITGGSGIQTLTGSATLSSGATELIQALAVGGVFIARVNPFANWPLGATSGFRLGGVYRI